MFQLRNVLTKKLSIVWVCCAVITSAASAQAQSSTRGSTTDQGRSDTRQQRPSFESRFWGYLKNARYENWAPAPGQNGEAYPGESPHGAFLKLYMNRKAITNLGDMPNGSILVKENYAEDGRTLAAITVIYRSTGFDPEHGDWYWAKFNPDGSVARVGETRLAGKVQSCIDCHAGAAGGDFVFLND